MFTKRCRYNATFAEDTTIIEPLSLDKLYLDVTENLQGIGVRDGDRQTDQGKDRNRARLTALPGGAASNRASR